MVPSSQTAPHVALTPFPRHTRHVHLRKHQHTTISCGLPAVTATTTILPTATRASRLRVKIGELQLLPITAPPLHLRKSQVTSFRQRTNEKTEGPTAPASVSTVRTPSATINRATGHPSPAVQISTVITNPSTVLFFTAVHGRDVSVEASVDSRGWII